MAEVSRDELFAAINGSSSRSSPRVVIPAYWMRADEQLELIDQEHADALREAVNGGGI